MDLSRAKEVVCLIQEMAQYAALQLFIIFWPVANLYLLVCWGLMSVGRGHAHGFLAGLGAFGLFLAFIIPVLAFFVFIVYMLMLPLAVISMRPLPMLLGALAWLSMSGIIPKGHVLLDAKAVGESDFLYPMIYSALTILASVIYIIRNDRRMY